jgi:hypothetical protein
LNRALTGPTLLVATAWNSVSESFSNVSQPGMLAFRASVSMSFCHTSSRGAGS